MISHRALALLPVSLIAVLAACGPVPVEQAEQTCLRDARLAAAPRGQVGVGIGSDSDGKVHPYTNIEIEVGSDYISGRDPAEVFNSCVYRRSGQPPRQPLYDQAGWRG